jgi:osmoprotectant transport system ATP-binding protein
MFILRQVCKRFGANVALDNVDTQLSAGRVTALIGPSGSGKSTLLRLLLGLEWPDSGTVLFDGAPLRRDNLLDHRRRIGYVIQEGGLFPHLTAIGNIGLLAETLGWSRSRVADRAGELARLCQLPADALQRYPAELSGGQRQRVGLIRALMLDPAVLLLDEPLGALDPLIRFDLQNELKALIEALGKTVVLVTHDIAEAVYLADELVLLHRGRLVQQGTPQQFLNAPSSPFVARFLAAQRSLGVPS